MMIEIDTTERHEVMKESRNVAWLKMTVRRYPMLTQGGAVVFCRNYTLNGPATGTAC